MKTDVIDYIPLTIVMVILALSWIYFLVTGYNVNFLKYETIGCMLIGAFIVASVFLAHRAYRRSKESPAD